eukprot:PhF_6_TR1398/c0_g1_i1/m.2421/K09880/mtnC, ENOPH1; enolase-phosphatase E1
MRTLAASDPKSPKVALPTAQPKDLVTTTTAALRYFVKIDSKAKEVKALQGAIWDGGFKSGALIGHVFPDVKPALELWKSQGVSVYIYSSGSIAAQKLLFGYTKDGDLLPWIRGHFDPSTVGVKTEAKSYTNIVNEIRKERPAGAIWFVSDNVSEVVASHEGGMVGILCHRPQNAHLSLDDIMRSLMFPHITTFSQLFKPANIG